ncbi:MAG: hypothetical protein EON48_16735, partial [Acetobacteraceae bacterium]
MTPPVTGVPLELQELPQVALDAIEAACAGDWRRVEATGPLEWLVHNKPVYKRIQLPDVRPQRHRASARKVTPRPIGPDRSDEVRQLPEGMDPVEAARLMAAEFAGGIAGSIRIELAEFVMNTPHSMVELGLAACRNPASVEVDPQSAEKGPRLRFVRGDVSVIVAFQNITLPF